jgi:hypothetical protein
MADDIKPTKPERVPPKSPPDSGDLWKKGGDSSDTWTKDKPTANAITSRAVKTSAPLKKISPLP